jgi:hypothetical protein
LYIFPNHNAVQKAGSSVEIVAYNAEEEKEDVIMQASVDRNLSISLISRSKASATRHPFVACQTPVEGMDASGQQYRAAAYVELRWFIRDGDPKSYEERFYVVDGLEWDALLGASALQNGR